MPNFQAQPKLLNAKLTALWAVSESGLGGMLHAIKIPFSGIFLGSFAIIIITFIARSSDRKFSAIMRATILVVMIKAIVSPHSPPMAYVAVLFQGVLGALFYGVLGVNKVTAMAVGAIALLESAFQKILTLTVIFGMGLWESVQQFFEGMQERFQVEWISDLPWLFLLVYGAVYFVVGLFAGNFAVQLPHKVLENAKNLKDFDFNGPSEIDPQKRGKKKRIWLIGGLLMFSVLVFVFSGSQQQALYIVLRTLAAVIFFLFVFNPLFKYFMQKWVKKKKDEEQRALDAIIELMPTIKNNVGLAQQVAKLEKGFWKRSRSFLVNWLSLSLYFDENGS